MVETWIGEMSGAKLVLLFAIQAFTMRWISYIHAENLPYDPGIDSEFQILEASKFDNNKDIGGMLAFEDSKAQDNDVADLDDTGFVDALWTVKPKSGGHKGYKNHNQNFKTKNHTSNNVNKHQKVNDKIAKDMTEVKSQYDVDVSPQDAPPLFDEPSDLDAPPLFDEPEMDAESSVTESVTQQITTEMDFEATTDEDEMLRRMHRRWRRKAIIVTVTTPEPTSTTPTQDDCEGDSYYDPEDDECSCPRGKMNTNTCDEDMDSSDEDDQDKSTNTYSGKAVGPYDNGDRALFENEIWKVIKSHIPGFNKSRVYVHQITYDPVTGTSNIQFDIISDKNLTPLDIWRLSSVVADITSNRTPLNINDQQVLWLDTANLTITEDDGTIISIPVSVDRNSQICYLYDQLGTCKNGALCVNTTGEPVCICTDEYHGKYCDVRIQRLADQEEENLLAILIPVLAGMCGLVFLCSCCFLFARRANKGDETSSVSSVPPVAFAVPKPLFHKPVDPTTRLYMEEIWEERPVIEYERVMIEEVLEPDHMCREPVYKYYMDTEDRFEERFETVSTSSTDSDSSNTRETWMDDASRIGPYFHIDRPACSSSAKSVYSDKSSRYKNGKNGKPGGKSS